jgi:hypothetical protein
MPKWVKNEILTGCLHRRSDFSVQVIEGCSTLDAEDSCSCLAVTRSETLLQDQPGASCDRDGPLGLLRFALSDSDITECR